MTDIDQRARAAAEARSRRATLRLTRDGAPLPAGTRVAVRQLRHRFGFGSNIFSLAPGDDSEAQRLYQERFAALLNFATLPFYWGRYEPEPGRPDEARLKAMARWCRDHGIRVKGHPLSWHTQPPAWFTDFSPEEMWERQLARTTREVTAFKGLVDCWDVVNEAVILPDFDVAPNHLTPLAKERGAVPLIAETFARAREANPGATLLLNDYEHGPAYDRLIGDCLEAGVPIDVIGIQSHMHEGYIGDDRVRELCDRLAVFGLPLHWTEATLVSGDLMADHDFHSRREHWPTHAAGEARQAEDAASFYTTLYEHPAVAAVTWWDLLDGHWLGAPGGLIREDRSPKPAYERLMGLIKGTWWYADQDLATDADGTITLDGPPGDYELTVDGVATVFAHDDVGEAAVALVVKYNV